MICIAQLAVEYLPFDPLDGNTGLFGEPDNVGDDTTFLDTT